MRVATVSAGVWLSYVVCARGGTRAGPILGGGVAEQARARRAAG
jgi:hypothetical protein